MICHAMYNNYSESLSTYTFKKDIPPFQFDNHGPWKLKNCQIFWTFAILAYFNIFKCSKMAESGRNIWKLAISQLAGGCHMASLGYFIYGSWAVRISNNLVGGYFFKVPQKFNGLHLDYILKSNIILMVTFCTFGDFQSTKKQKIIVLDNFQH